MTEATDERLILCTSTHWMKYVPIALKDHFLLLLGISLLYVSGIAALQSVSLITFGIGSILIVYSHHHFFHKLMSESMYDIFITSERIIYFDDSLFFVNDEHEVPLHRIASIEVNQEGIVPNIFDYGTLWIDTGGSSIDFRRSVPHVPKPEDVNKTITQLLRSH